MQPLSLAAINRRNREFWVDQTVFFYKRLSDDAVRDVAFEILHAQSVKAMPLRFQLCLHGALDEAAKAKRIFLRDFARKGGAARKAVALQRLIEAIVDRRPRISAQQLYGELEGYYERRHVIHDIADGKIYFTNLDGREKAASVKGLKDRLSRAKKSRSR
jgi:hypothetical protein